MFICRCQIGWRMFSNVSLPLSSSLVHNSIPLAQKLRECGVFGVSSDEYWTYAKHNRAEWQARGKEIVAEMVQKCSVSP